MNYCNIVSVPRQLMYSRLLLWWHCSDYRKVSIYPDCQYIWFKVSLFSNDWLAVYHYIKVHEQKVYHSFLDCWQVTSSLLSDIFYESDIKFSLIAKPFNEHFYNVFYLIVPHVICAIRPVPWHLQSIIWAKPSLSFPAWKPHSCYQRTV